MKKIIQTGILFTLAFFVNIASANNCNVRYDEKRGDATLPCVKDESGNYYRASMKRKSDGDFKVTFVDEFNRPQLPAELQKAELIGEKLLLIIVSYTIPSGSCPFIIEDFSHRDNNEIQVRILRNAFHTMTCGLSPEHPVTTAQVMKVLPGVAYDIYINDELKETVNVK